MRKQTHQFGFTLIEMIVSLGVFASVITISVGALLVLVASNEQLQGEQSVMTNLSFALDSMTREIRTGINYYCDSQNSTSAGPSGRKIFNDGEVLDYAPVSDCQNGNNTGRTYHGISFVEGGRSITGAADTRIVYFFDEANGKLFRRVSGGDAISIVSDGIFIENAEFFVTGSAPYLGSNDVVQPVVTIFIEATEANDPTDKVYQLQTTVTQRTLDL